MSLNFAKFQSRFFDLLLRCCSIIRFIIRLSCINCETQSFPYRNPLLSHTEKCGRKSLIWHQLFSRRYKATPFVTGVSSAFLIAAVFIEFLVLLVLPGPSVVSHFPQLFSAFEIAFSPWPIGPSNRFSSPYFSCCAALIRSTTSFCVVGELSRFWETVITWLVPPPPSMVLLFRSNLWLTRLTVLNLR